MREFYKKTCEALKTYKEKKQKEEKLKALKDDKNKDKSGKKRNNLNIILNIFI